MGYIAMSVGPLIKGMPNMAARLFGIGYIRRLKFGKNPLKSTPKLQLPINGLRRENGIRPANSRFFCAT